MAVAAAIKKNKSDEVKILINAVIAIREEAIDIGINMPLIPVLDVNKNPDNPIICTRAFSDNPEEVVWYGKKYIKALEDSGLISCAKHFPGHGNTSIDSHISLPVISKSLKDLMDTDIFPFKEAIKEGISSIMVGHLSIPAIDTVPAPLSKNIITGLLRRELGFEGLILTDALNMNALKKFRRVSIECINAGVDILLHPADADLVFEELNDAVTSGEIDNKKIDTAVDRILKYKSRIKNIQISKTDYDKHAELFKKISDKSITLVKDTPGLLPIKDLQSISLLFAADENRHDISALKKYIHSPIDIKKYTGEALNEVVILSLFTSIAAWKGSSGINDDDVKKIKELIKTPGKSIVISFGSPYVLRHFTEADMLVAAYDTTEQAQLSVIKCLNGERDFRGKLPVELN
jgi:beta-glucosidase-like glycosyl hydrolase